MEVQFGFVKSCGRTAFVAAFAASFAMPFCANATQIVPGDYAKSFNIAFTGYRGTETLVDFPVLTIIVR